MRLKPTVVQNKKIPLAILMDERYDKLDARMSRMIFSAIEVPAYSEIINKAKQTLSTVRNIFGTEQKFHFASMDIHTQEKVIEIISNLDILCKMYVFYAINMPETDMKTTTLIWSIKNTEKALYKQHTLNFLIERAEQYKQIIRSANLIDDSELTIIPDAFCYNFARRLDEKTSFNWYNNLSDKIRLESYFIEGDCVREMRSGRLPKLR